MPKILNLFDENENFLARAPFSIYAEDKSSGEIPLKGVGAGLAEKLVHPQFFPFGHGPEERSEVFSIRSSRRGDSSRLSPEEISTSCCQAKHPGPRPWLGDADQKLVKGRKRIA